MRERFGLITASSVRKVAAVMLAAGVSRAAQLLAAMVVARQFTPAQYGVYVFTIGAALVASAIGGLGWQLSFNRLMPQFVAGRRWGHVAGLLRAADRVTLLGCAAAAGILAITSFADRDLRAGLLFAAILTIPQGFTQLRRQQLAGAGHAPLSLLIDQGLTSGAVAFAALVMHLTLAQVIWVYAFGLVAGCVATTVIVRRTVHPDARAARPAFEIRDWALASWSMLVGQLARLLLSRLDVLLLPALSTLAEAGLYGAALRVTYVLTFPQMILQTLIGPLLGNAFAVGHRAHARRLLLYSIAFAVATSLPVALAICIDPAWVLAMLFGPQYHAAAVTLVLLTFGQLGVSISIPLGAALMMGGAERAFWRSNVAILIGSVVLALVLIPPYGAFGAAIVGLVSGLALCVSQAWLCWPVLRDLAPEHPAGAATAGR